jgi:hypothetical protein
MQVQKQALNFSSSTCFATSNDLPKHESEWAMKVLVPRLLKQSNTFASVTCDTKISFHLLVQFTRKKLSFLVHLCD